MRPAFRVLRAVAALGGAAALAVPALTAPAGAADQTVQVGQDNENRFAPASVTVNVGNTVTWQYAGGTGHTVTSATANWSKDDPVGPPGIPLTVQTTYKFDAAGTYRYICKTHEAQGMKGTVVVVGKAKPKPTPTHTSTRTPSPTASRTSTPPPPTEPGTPTPSSGTASPALPSASLLTPSPTTPPPLPSVAPPTAEPSRFLGEGGLTPQPATGRERGLPAMLALLLIGGVGSAELRALLASAPPE